MGKHDYGLKRELGLLEATLYGVGIILGAGIYALIGKGAGLAGNTLWLSFVVAAVVAAFSGLSYAELSSMYSKTAAEYNYTLRAFNRKNLSLFVGLLMVAAGTASAATVSLGFAGYFTHLFGGAEVIAAGALIVLLSLINYVGIRESSKYNIIATLIEVGGLFLIIAIGISSFGDVNYLETAQGGFSGVITASALIFFAYIGFENVVNLSEEAKSPVKIIPKALIWAIIISTILYILVAVSAVSIIGWERLSESSAPMSEVVSDKIPQAGIMMSLIALFATSNTVLITLIVSSRILYGISKDDALPKFLSKVGRRGTPYNAVLIAAIAALLLIPLGNIETVAMLTNFAIFAVYLFVNLSLITLRYTQPDVPRPFRAPVNIGRFPVLAFLGVLSCIAMIYFVLDYLV